MSAVPARCSLSAGDLADVAERYARAAERYQATIHYERDRAVLDLRGPMAELGPFLEEMVLREGSCCSHLRFDVSDTGQGYRVVLTVDGAPDQEQDALRQIVPVLFPGAVPASSTGPAQAETRVLR